MDDDETAHASSKKLLDAFGIEKPIPHTGSSRLDPNKHNPLWGQEIAKLDDYLYLIELDPCPLPVNGKLATTVRFSVESDGEAECLKREVENKQTHERRYQRERAMAIRATDSPADIARKSAELKKEYVPQPRQKYEWVTLNENQFSLGQDWIHKVKISCPVLKQFIEEGGFIGVSERLRLGPADFSTDGKCPTVHLSGDYASTSSLCGRGHGSGHGLHQALGAAYAGQPEEVGTYKVCSSCRRIAEARPKRKVVRRKPKPKGPKPPTPEEIAREERLRAEHDKRVEESRKRHEAYIRKEMLKLLDTIENYYPKVDQTTRDAALQTLIVWFTGEL